MSQEDPTKTNPAFTTYTPSTYRIRYMVIVAQVVDATICEQLDNDELCLEETERCCCICGAPTCYHHERKPFQACVHHAATPNPKQETLCCVCQTCDVLPREVQVEIYHFRRRLEGKEHAA